MPRDQARSRRRPQPAGLNPPGDERQRPGRSGVPEVAIYLAEKKLPEALDAIDRAAAKSPAESGVHNLRGVILNEMERYDEAIRSLETAVTLAPKDIGANVNLGIALMNRGDNARAKDVLEKVYPEIKDPALKDKVAEYIKAVGGIVK
jgi:Flp pilus assembly protein TadD